MSPAEDRFEQTLTSGRLKAVYAAWKVLSDGRVGPRRAEVKPAHLRRDTPWTFTVDVLDGGKDFRCGFAGDRLMQFLDRDCRAPTLGGLKGNHFFDEAGKLFLRCVTSRKPVASGPKPTSYTGKEHLEREVLLLPLSEDGTTVTGLLGAFDTWRLGTHPHSTAPVVAD